MDLETEKRLTKLLSSGKQVEATSPSIDINKPPDYLNLDRFQRAQKVCQKYYTNISICSSIGLMLILQIESILIPLLKTGKSRTVSDLFDRYVATALYIRNIYETNFYEHTSKGWENINFVRGMHKRIHKLMKEDPSVTQQPPNVWVNQYDMAITQFGFIGLFLLYPDKCGAYHVSKQELSDVVYYWRLISFYFGIEEEFNLFVYDDPKEIDKQLEYLKVVFNFMKSELLENPRPETGLRMAEGFTLAFEEFTTESSFNILDHWWSPVLSLSGKSELSPYSWGEIWKLLFFKLYIGILFRNDTMLAVINWIYKRKFDRFRASGDQVKMRLNEKHKNIVYE